MFRKWFQQVLDRAIEHMKAKEYDQALDVFQAMVKAEPGNPQGYLNVARACYHLHDQKALKENLKKCVSLNPDQETVRGILEITNWKLVASPQYFNHAPIWSGDGLWLCYPSVREDTDGDGQLTANDRAGLYIYDTVRRTEWEILSNEQHTSFPSFSPEARRLLYLSGRKDTNRDGQVNAKDQGALYLCDLDSGKETLLISEEHRIKYPSFTPDGKSIIFCGWRKGGRNSGIYQLELESKTEKVLVTDYFENTFPMIAPDGHGILFSSWRDDTNRDGVIDLRDNSALFHLDLSTGRERLMAPDTWSNSYPVWGPDSRRMAYLSRRRDTNKDGQIDHLDNSAIMLADVPSGREELLVSDADHNKFPVFSSSGKDVAFVGSWRRTLGPEEEPRHYFENKGIYVVSCETKKLRQIVSDKYFGCRFLAASPKQPQVAFLSWTKGTRRGLYLAHLEELPRSEELDKMIEQNI